MSTIIATINMPNYVNINHNKKTSYKVQVKSMCLKEKINLMRKVIKFANTKNKDDNLIEYKQAWNEVFILSNILRDEIEKIENCESLDINNDNS